MGANLVPGGAAFRVWAPRATAVHILGDFNEWIQNEDALLNQLRGHWVGFVPGATAGQSYKFHVTGPTGLTSFKRDPYARELTFEPEFPFSNCVLNDPKQFPWHAAGFVPPAFNDLIIYQLHVGTFSVAPQATEGKFLDVLDRLDYLVTLGVNAIQPLPIVEFPTQFSLGYNGTDYFSPESMYAVADPAELEKYRQRINAWLARRNLLPYALSDLEGSANQLRAMVDVCHAGGLAVILDVVYNHAGGGFDSDSIYFLDVLPRGNQNDSLYFTDNGWAGGLVFAYWNQDVRQFLIDNALFLQREYRIDGFRYDEVSVMDRFGGWKFCQDLADTCRFAKPSAIQIAEYWPVNAAVTRPTNQGGAGFDATWHDGLRESVRAAVGQASAGATAPVDLDRVANCLQSNGLPDLWRGVNCLENHDIVKHGERPRLAVVADGSDPTSWYARSRARVATGLLFTAPGIPMLFMGQEMLEAKQWSDDPTSGLLISWETLAGNDPTSRDFLHCCQDLARLRRRQPALRSAAIHVFHVHAANRVIAFHRWIEGQGRDVVVVASWHEQTYYDYVIGFPGSGRWLEVFNSDVYDHWVNPLVAGNGGARDVFGPPAHGLPCSTSVVLPANGLVVFARDAGD